MPHRLPRPHRDDVRIALGGLLGGLFLWGVGPFSRTGDDPITLIDRKWAVLLPLAVTAGCELLRRTRPRTALLVGTAAVCVNLITPGSLATVLMFTALVYAAVLHGTAASARRIPWITGLLTVVGSVVPYVARRTPEALLIGAAVGLVTLGTHRARGDAPPDRRVRPEAGTASGADPAVLDALTRREREVLSCLGEGMPNAEIADRLDMAEAMVKTHVSRLPAKPGLRSRVQAAVLAQELGV